MTPLVASVNRMLRLFSALPLNAVNVRRAPSYSKYRVRGRFDQVVENMYELMDAIVGGGESVEAVKASGFADRISHISTGGGASLEFISGATLPGVEVLRLS